MVSFCGNILVCRPFCYKTCTRILRVQPRLQMGQVSIIENSLPQKRSQKSKPHFIAPGLCYAVKNECFFKIYIVCFPLLPTWCSTARFSIQFSRVIFNTSFSQDNMKNLPNKTGPENFLYYIVSRWNNYFKLWLRKDQFFVVDKWHFVQNRFLLFVSLLCSVFFFFLHW